MDYSPRELALTAINAGRPSRIPVGASLGGSWPLWRSGLTLEATIGDTRRTADVFHGVNKSLGVDLSIIGAGSTATLARALGGRVTYNDRGAPEIEPFVTSIADIERIDVPSALADPSVHWLRESAQAIAELNNGERMILVSGRAPFTLAAQFAGLERLSRALYRDRAFTDAILDMTTRLASGFYEMMLEAEGVDGAFIADPTASGDVISGRHFAQYAAPCLERVIAVVKGRRKPSMVHICGDITDRLRIVADTGAESVSLDAKVDMAQARGIVGSSICLAGNVDPVRALQFGSPAEIRDAVWRVLDAGARDGAFILLPGCDISDRVSEQNLRSFVEAARTWSEKFIR